MLKNNNKIIKINLPISVIIITKNAEHSIKKTLDSVSWANEIIIVDSNSTDQTAKICQSYNVIFKNYIDWPGFGKQKNRALRLVSNPWVLSIDSDEVVSDELSLEIIKAVKTNLTNTAFYVKRKNFFCGQLINYSGWQNDYVLRLFPKRYGQFSKDIVHEKVVFSGILKKINAPLYHYSYKNYSDVTDKIHRYSSAGADILLSLNKRITFDSALSHAFWSFFRTYFLKLGFLDGKNGLIIAFMNLETTFYKYLKAIDLKKLNNNKQSK